MGSALPERCDSMEGRHREKREEPREGWKGMWKERDEERERETDREEDEGAKHQATCCLMQHVFSLDSPADWFQVSVSATLFIPVQYHEHTLIFLSQRRPGTVLFYSGWYTDLWTLYWKKDLGLLVNNRGDQCGAQVRDHHKPLSNAQPPTTQNIPALITLKWTECWTSWDPLIITIFRAEIKGQSHMRLWWFCCFDESEPIWTWSDPWHFTFIMVINQGNSHRGKEGEEKEHFLLWPHCYLLSITAVEKCCDAEGCVTASREVQVLKFVIQKLHQFRIWEGDVLDIK